MALFHSQIGRHMTINYLQKKSCFILTVKYIIINLRCWYSSVSIVICVKCVYDIVYIKWSVVYLISDLLFDNSESNSFIAVRWFLKKVFYYNL